MTRRKSSDEPATEAANPAVPAEQRTESQPALDVNSTEPAQQGKSTWASHFGSWADYEAGVKLIEDRENRRLTIKFDEKPSEAVRGLMKNPERGFRFDPDDQVWYKRLNHAKPGQSRREAEELAFDAANMIRQEKGLQTKKAFSLGM